MREEINNIFIIWDTQGVDVARKELLKLYLEKYDKLNNIEDKRLILYNLICAESDMGLSDMVKVHSEILIRDMNNEEGYKEDYEENFVRVLAHYRDSHLDQLSKEQVMNINKYCKNVFDKYNDVNNIHFLDKLISNFNFYLYLYDENKVLEIIKTTKLNIKINKSEYTRILKDFLRDINIFLGKESYKKALKIIE